MGAPHCRRPPLGWACSRAPEHSGPCAAYPLAQTALTYDEFSKFLDEAVQLLDLLKGTPSTPLARGLMGVALIQDCIRQTGGNPQWWADLVKTGRLPFGTAIKIVVDGG